MQCIQFSGAVQRGSSCPLACTTGLPCTQRIHTLPVNFPHPIFSQPNLSPDSKHPLTSFLLPYILCLLNTWLLLRLLSSYTEGIHLRRYRVGCTLNMNAQLGNSWHLVFSYESHKMLERSDQRLQDCLKGRWPLPLILECVRSFHRLLDFFLARILYERKCIASLFHYKMYFQTWSFIK